MPLPTVAYRLIGRFSVSRFDRWLHPLLYRATGGRGIVGRVLGSEMLLLTTTGRRTGVHRTVALFAFPVAEPAGSWAVIGSRGGSREIPAWYRNLGALPEATIQVRRARTSVRPREVFGPEYEAIFEGAATTYPGYRLYRAEAPHHIPIVVLEPVAAADPDPDAAASTEPVAGHAGAHEPVAAPDPEPVAGHADAHEPVAAPDPEPVAGHADAEPVAGHAGAHDPHE